MVNGERYLVPDVCSWRVMAVVGSQSRRGHEGGEKNAGYCFRDDVTEAVHVGWP